MKIDSVVFFTNNLDRIVDFYQNKLNFELEYLDKEKYVSFIFENGVRLGIKLKNSKREIPGSQTVILQCDDIETKYNDLLKIGILMEKKLVKQSWGITFSFLDPDGNKVEFVKR